MTNTLALTQLPYSPAGNTDSTDVNYYLSEGTLSSKEKGWQSAISALGRMISLGDDWDEMGAAAPDLEVIAAAMRLAEVYRKSGSRSPDRVLASPMGTVSFEWFQDLGSLMEVEVVSKNVWEWIEYRQGIIVDRGYGEFEALQFDRIPPVSGMPDSVATSSREWEIAV